MRSTVLICLLSMLATSGVAQVPAQDSGDAANALATALYDLPSGNDIPGNQEWQRVIDTQLGGPLKLLNPGRERDIDSVMATMLPDLRNSCVVGVRKEIAHRIITSFTETEIDSLNAFSRSLSGRAYFANLRRLAYTLNGGNAVIPDSPDARRTLNGLQRLHFTKFYEDVLSNKNHWIRASCEAGEAIAVDTSSTFIARLKALNLKIPQAGEKGPDTQKTGFSEIDDPKYQRALSLIAKNDPIAAAEILEKLSKGGNISAKVALGGLYYGGNGIPRDLRRAFVLFSEAAAAHDAQAEYDLAVMYAGGEGTERDSHAAFELFYRAAEGGYPRAEYALADRYNIGDGVQKSPENALLWYRRSAEEGFAPSQVKLGQFYKNGILVGKDYAVALGWFEKAARQSDRRGQYELGVSYLFGRGAPQDSALALSWILKSAEQGLPDAQTVLGASYAEGNGVPKDMAAAVKWYLRAANQGHGGAQFNLGFAYGLGQGVPINPVEAYKWFGLSISRPETLKPEAARFNRDHAASQLTPSQLETAKALVASWQPHAEPRPVNP